MHSPDAARRQRQRGLRASALNATWLQMMAQLLLWVFFFGYDQSLQAVWQAVCMLIAPMLALWFLWRGTRADHPSAKWWHLPLTLCLAADAFFLTAVLGGFTAQVVPTYPAWLSTLLPSAVCYLTALRARPRGVKYGASLLAAPIAVLFVISTVFLRASSRGDRIWPILGDGLLSTAQSALTGAGAAWGAALLFVTPAGGRRAALRPLLAPWLVALIFALWFGFLRPWTPGDDLAVAEKVMGLVRHAHNVVLYEISSILWMLLLPAALTACVSTAGELIGRALPRLPAPLALLPVPLLGAAAALLWPDRLFSILTPILPWRYALSALCGAGLWLTQRRRA